MISLCGFSSRIGPFRFRFLPCLQLSAPHFLSLSPQLFCSWPWAWLFFFNLCLSFIHFVSHWQVAGLKCRGTYKLKLGLCVLKTVAEPFRGWLASAKVAVMCASWSHGAAHACCALPLSLRISPHLPFFCRHLCCFYFLPGSLTQFSFFFLAACVFIKPSVYGCACVSCITRYI